jgi:hypothetical protein
MSAPFTIEQFAVMSRKCDRARGLIATWQSYLDEARYYLGIPRVEWPCTILLQAGIHKKEHPNCKTTDWRD